jgi:hypothetical protein
MAVFTLDFIDEMGTGIMFGPFLFVATVAGHGLGMDPCPFGLNMLFDVSNIPVAAITGVCPVNRLGKFPLIDLASVTTQAFRVIDALVTVFTAFDDKLLSLFGWLRSLYPFSRFGALFPGGWLGGPEPSHTQEKDETENDESGKYFLSLRFHKSPDIKKIPPLFP